MREETAVNMYALRACLLSDTASMGTHSCTRANCSLKICMIVCILLRIHVRAY